MKVLMFGWEFPPHISGGLGTASYGLTRGMYTIGGIDILFVVPKAYGDEDQNIARVIGAGDVIVKQHLYTFSKLNKQMNYFQVESKVVPYVDPEDFWKLKKKEVSADRWYVQTDEQGKIKFSGKYGADLLEEIRKYALVASVIARENEFDVIHAHDWLAYPAGIAAKAVSGKPLVIHVHATDFDRSRGNVNPEVYAIEKQGMDVADKIIAVSNLTRNIIIEKYRIPQEKVITVHNAVDPVTTDQRNFEKGQLGDKIVTFLGRITMQKGPEYFVEAASRVLQRMDQVRFVMAGSGDMMQKMIALAAAKGIMNRFHFTGFLKGDEVYRMLHLSDVYVMPSVSEPFGISPLEALQSSVPVIISHQSGVAEILTHALKINFWDIDAMSDSIYALLNYPALTKMFTKYGKEEVNRLKWENAAQKVREIYLSLVSN
ncbi:MAG: glycosyltransferase family 4 protein [Chlorobi bacterium]|nr:glycosyltransferase family 4 protein [Chlorobiota bacterium]